MKGQYRRSLLFILTSCLLWIPSLAWIPVASFQVQQRYFGATSTRSRTKIYATTPAPDVFDSDTRQLLGIKNPAHVNGVEKWKIRLQLTKPITWLPLSLIVMCGAAASGQYHWIWNPWDPNDRDLVLGVTDAMKGLATVILAGPFSEGFAQTINDWYDRDIDAINEPYRPVPSGAITPREVFAQLLFLFMGGMALAMGLDVVTAHEFPVISAIALFGYFMSYIYSAPPLKLKQNGWTGDLAIGLCYISLPWWCGQAVFSSAMDKPVDWILPVVLSLTGIGAGIVNDFKSIEGDKAFGLQSIPILLGVDKAKWLAALIPDLVQLSVAAYLYSIQEVGAAAAVASLVLPQMYFQSTLLLRDPFKYDTKYMAMSQPFSFMAVLATALCIGQHDWGAI